MESYCNAIEAAKLSTKASGCATIGSSFCDETLFREFVKSDIDLRDISSYMADFSQSSDVAQALHGIRGALQSGFQQRLAYVGTLAQVGSFYDGSKTGRLNEMDCLYIVNDSDVVVQQVCKGHFSVCVNGIAVKPRELNKNLIAAMRETLSEMALPDGWTHGGYASPDYCGVRCNGPAVTAMFCNKDENHISLDVSIAFPLTSQLQRNAEFPPHLRDNCQILSDTVRLIQSELTSTQISTDIHLIGNLVDDTWQQTTALAEAKILRALRPDFSVKRALEICKVIASKLQKWYNEDCVVGLLNDNGERMSRRQPELRPEGDRHLILRTLHQYMRISKANKAQLHEHLNRNMTYQHIWLSSSEREEYKEVLKAEASVNAAAMKHVILKSALQISGAFSGQNNTCTEMLVRAVFEELSDHGSFTAPHAFLCGTELLKFSLSVHLSSTKYDVARDLQKLCQVILDDGLKKVCCVWNLI